MDWNRCWADEVTLRVLIIGFCEEGRVDNVCKIAVEKMASEDGAVSSNE